MKFVDNLKEVFKHKHLIYELTYAEFKSKYKQSVLGIAWALFRPLSLTLIYSVIFTLIVRMPSDGVPYPIFVFSALLPWTLFSAGLNRGVTSVYGNSALLKKIYFPREVIVLASVLGGFVDFVFGFLVFILMMVYYSVPLTWNIFYVVLILASLFFLTLGVSLALSALNVFMRDITHLIPVLTQIWMYLSPIIYPLSTIPDRFLNFYLLNPVVGILDSFRNVFARGIAPNLTYLGISVVMSLVIFFVGYSIFKKLEMRFADVI